MQGWIALAMGAVRDAVSEPTRMDVQVVNKDGAYSHTNIIFVERLGNVKFYDGNYDQAINPGAFRVTYTGTCKVPVALAEAPKPEAHQKIRLSSNTLDIGEQGRHEFSLFDLSGKAVFRTEGASGARYDFASLDASAPRRTGVYVVKVKTAQGMFVRQDSLM